MPMFGNTFWSLLKMLGSVQLHIILDKTCVECFILTDQYLHKQTQ